MTTILGALALIGAFAVIEARSAAPLVPPRVLRSRSLVGGNLLMVTAGMCVDGMLVTLTGFVQRELGWSAARFGLVATVMTATSVVGVLASQRLITRFGVRPVAAAGSIGLSAACLLLSRVSPDAPIGIMVTGLLIFGAGMGGAFVGAQIAAFTGVEQQNSGLAAGLIDTSFAVGTALGVAVCTSVTLTASYRTAFAATATFALAGLLVTLLVLRAPTPAAADPAGTLAEKNAA